MFQVLHHAITDVGKKRDHNEDAYLIDVDRELFVVCDGMGGHTSGEVASALAINSLAEFFNNTCRNQGFQWPFPGSSQAPFEQRALHNGILFANACIFEESNKSPDRKGMGTTVCAAVGMQDDIVLAHVGDSRIYRYRSGQLTRLTEDHSLINHYKRKRDVSDAELEVLKSRSNVIVRALGLRTNLEVDLRVEKKIDGDFYLLCSDGLTDLLNDTEIENIMRKHRPSLDVTAQALVDEANARGGKDNITVLIFGFQKKNGADPKVVSQDDDTLRDYDVDHSDFDVEEDGSGPAPRPKREADPSNSAGKPHQNRITKNIVVSGMVNLDENARSTDSRTVIQTNEISERPSNVELVPPIPHDETSGSPNIQEQSEPSSKEENTSKPLDSRRSRSKTRDPDLRDVILASKPISVPMKGDE